MRINSNIRVEAEDFNAGIWIIFNEREHEALSRSDARALMKFIKKVLGKKAPPPSKRQRQ